MWIVQLERGMQNAVQTLDWLNLPWEYQGERT